ncbi:probable LRR receptor-like serine/threonine-protein kinase At3g47570 isoform X2 [Cornus florida]|uniref:probable LRR receptor-like serine/threonine-protein kinase At3g47570 isoform X2 n=1 Tax=Cornus florida TaxID=4283 RepID=UPI002897B11C|nr:probable LRR receptor-like serine/threonine-protein kinase At3g47570 isoform X2 [Cornus florida]
MMEKTSSLVSVTFLLLVHYYYYSLMACLAVTVSTSRRTATNITTDQSALLALKSHITSDPRSILANNWTTSTSHCNWIGVHCSTRHHRVAVLNLSYMGLRGTIPPHIGNLSFLAFLDIRNNSFYGNVPEEIGHLRRLESINFFSNDFTGNVPKEIGKLASLKFLNMRWNQLSGSIPAPIFNISSLETISFTSNSLSGNLPADMCYLLPKLSRLNLSHNQFEGQIPSTLDECSKLQTLSLSYNKFCGAIPREIGNLTFLKWLYLGANNLEGNIPTEIGKLANLKDLDMGWNQLSGSLPASIFNISSLEGIGLDNNTLSGNLPMDMCYSLPKLYSLSLSYNQFDGQIPSCECSELQTLWLSNNKFNGEIPRDIGNLTFLKELYLGGNNLKGKIPQLGNLHNLEILSIKEAGLTGAIPEEIGNLHDLDFLDLSLNRLKGPIPETIFNMSKLRILSLVNNYHLLGKLPSRIRLPNLEGLYIAGNKFNGIIPHSISNLSKLTHLELSNNNFNHSIPNSLGNLRQLEFLDLSWNNFNSESPNQELSFIIALTNCKHLTTLWIDNNPLNGILLVSVGNFSTSLQDIRASYCEIKGSIPNHIGNLTNLAFLSLSGNGFTGSIPTTMKELQKIQILDFGINKIQGPIPNNLCHLHNLGLLALNENELFGPIPTCLGNITSLRKLFLGSNKLSSTVPINLFSLKDILYMDLSSNSLSGYLPSEIGTLKAAIQIDLSLNRFSGDIPNSIGGLQSLIILSLAHNKLQGPIPQSFGNLISLQSLDLSYNNLSGIIPKSMESLLLLQYFNASFNRLRGEIPSGGPFVNFINQSFKSNEALCGAPQFQVPPCRSSSLHRSRTKKIVLVVYILLPIALIALILTFVSIKCRKRNRIPIETDLLPMLPQGRISHQELLCATDGFSDKNLLGMGSYGSVYRGRFTDGTIFAIKVFNEQLEGASKSFDTECEMLRNIRHRNLTRIINSCSNLDFRALVLQYMPNGSLEKWLYSPNYFLDILQRLDIMIDLACALDYLHHGYSIPLAHCDLKPNNVLLDENMVAHLSDFGISKFLGEGESITHTKTLATLGYIAPEYGSEGLVSTRCDVYSYGIMLMEIFTRTKPTDDMFVGDLSLKVWVSESLRNAIIKVTDASLLSREGGQLGAKVQCVSSIMQLALKCCAESPQDRINIKEALATLKKIKHMFLASREGNKHEDCIALRGGSDGGSSAP